jgi:hypothetical protein
MEESGQARLGDHVVERVRARVVRKEGLEIRMELESPDAVLGYQSSCTLDRVRAGRIDTRKRDEHIGVCRRRFGDLLVRDRRDPALRLPVDGEDDGRHLSLAVVLGDVIDGRQRLL